MNTDARTFDAVQMMREIRDKISLETQDMTFEELKTYIQQQLAEHDHSGNKAS